MGTQKNQTSAEVLKGKESHYITTGHVSMGHLRGRAAENYLSFIFFLLPPQPFISLSFFLSIFSFGYTIIKKEV